MAIWEKKRFKLIEKKLRKILKPWVIFLLILAVGMYLRFYRIEYVESFEWDQVRDSWVVRNILMGDYALLGPRTGIGHFHLPPLYYYFLAPFFYIWKLDPVALNYFNMLMNVINFVIIYKVTKNIFNEKAGLFVSLIYAVSHYLIGVNRVPWNVTLMPGVAALIFYGITQIYKERYKWVFGVWALSGFYFNLHFTAVFVTLIVLVSLMGVKDKVKVVKYSLFSLPLYFVWLIPTIIYFIQGGDDFLKFQDFWNVYYIGLHFRFMLHRLSFALVQFDSILYYSGFKLLKFVLPAIYGIWIVFFEKDSWKKLLGYLISLWFIIPLIGFTLYGGPLSEYYFLYNSVMVLYVFWYLQEKLLKTRFKQIFIILLLIFWGTYIYQNTKDLWVKPIEGGFKEQRDYVEDQLAKEGSISFSETDIRSYLFTIWGGESK